MEGGAIRAEIRDRRPIEAPGGPRQEGVTLGDLNKALAAELTALLKAIGAGDSKKQEPAFSDADPEGLSVLCRPLTGKAGGRGGDRGKR